MSGPQPTVIVNNRGCGSGCGSFIAVFLVVGAAYQYWYVAVPLGVIVLAGMWWNQRRQPAAATTTAISTPSGPAEISAPLASAGWRPDPTGRHESRFWDGTGWTDNVSDAGTPRRDPL